MSYTAEADAGLTRGGFYSHFKNKEELYAEAITLILEEHPAARWEDIQFDLTSKDVDRINCLRTLAAVDQLQATYQSAHT